MPPLYAKEFTSEMNQGYLASLLNPIEQDEQASIARAKTEGAAGGLGMQAATGSRIGALEAGASTAREGLISKFNMDVAGKQREERLTDEQRTFQDLERQKTEAFQKSMTEMGYAFEDSQREAKRKSDNQFNTAGFVSGLASGALSAGVGGYFGGLGKAKGLVAGGGNGGGGATYGE